MKTIIALACLVALSGCHNFPRDSYMTGVKSTINTPWGPSTIEAAVVATGTAAKNVSLPDVVPPVKK